jgi:hypothetical protein
MQLGFQLYLTEWAETRTYTHGMWKLPTTTRQLRRETSRLICPGLQPPTVWIQKDIRVPGRTPC